MKSNYNIGFVFLLLIVPVIMALLPGCWRTSDTYIREGNSFYRDSLYNEAAAAYENALKKDPESYPARYNLAVAYYRLKKFKEAEKLFSGLLAKAGNDTARLEALCYNLGNTLFAGFFANRNETGRLSDTVNSLYGMIDSESDIVQKVHMGIAQDSLMKLNDSLQASGNAMLEQSIGMYKKALRYDGGDPDAKYNLCYVMKFKKDMNFYDSSRNNSPQTDPTPYALMLKKQADSLVSLYRFLSAWELMDFGEKKDTTIKTYNSFINKLKDVKDIK